MPYTEFCQQMYNDQFYHLYNEILDGRNSQAAQIAAEREAQNLQSKRHLSVHWKDTLRPMRRLNCGEPYMLPI